MIVPVLALLAAAEAHACTPATAEEVPVAAAWDPAMGGRCVTVQGLAWDHRLYRDVPAIYAAQFAPPRDGSTLGLSAPARPAPIAIDRTRRDTRRERAAAVSQLPTMPNMEATFAPRWVKVTGRIASCAADRAATQAWAGEQALISSSAVCHGQDHYLRDVSMTFSALPPPNRLLRGDLPPDRWRLTPLDPASPWHARFAAAADIWAAAIRSGRTGQWAPLMGGDFLARADRDRITAQLRADGPPRRFATAKKAWDRRVILGWLPGPNLTEADRAAAAAAPEAVAIICWSDRADADRLWPIAAFDADNAPLRPYACARFTYSIRDGTDRWRASLESSHWGLGEPTLPSAI